MGSVPLCDGMTHKLTSAMAMALAALVGVGCSASTDDAAVSESSAVVTAAAPSTTAAPTTAAPETTAAPTTAASETTAAPTTAAPTTTAPAASTTLASGEAISEDLELLELLRVSLGAGSGEYTLLVDQMPEGYERFKVSTSGADGYCNARILDVQTVPDGVAITVLPDCGGTTFGVAWVHEDGRRSDITYRDCSAGITMSTSC